MSAKKVEGSSAPAIPRDLVLSGTHLDQKDPKITYSDGFSMADLRKSILIDGLSTADLQKPISSMVNLQKSYFKPGTYLDQKEQEVTITDFVYKELILSFIADFQRSIPSMVDGLKTVQRKILFCAFKKNLVEKENVCQFSCYVSKQSAYDYDYHDEQCLVSTIVGMAHDYVGSNNINLLVPAGLYGTRWLGGKDGGKKQHLSTMLSPITRVLFPKDDDAILNYLNENGKIIEPTWYMPIIPTVLVNGSEGIGTGCTTFIPHYNPREIVANIRRLLNGESMVPMDPWYRGFKGTIEKTPSKEVGCTYTVTGLYEEVDDTCIRITELPIGKWTADYKEFVTSLPLLQDHKNHIYVMNSVMIDLKLTKENMEVARKEGFLKTFELTRTISTSNMHLFDKEGVIKKYATPEQILEEFFELRLKYYELRKKIRLENLELELQKLNGKVRYILEVRSGNLIVSAGKTKAELVQELREKGFTPLPKKATPVEAAVAGDDVAEESSMAPEPSSTAFVPGSEYDYLLAMSLGTLTCEKFQELLAEINKMNEAVAELVKSTPKALWHKDLEALDKELDKLDLDDAKAEEEMEAIKAKARASKGWKQPAKKATEPESSNSVMGTDNIVAEVVKPKGRQPAKKKAPAAKKVEEEDDMLDLQWLAECNLEDKCFRDKAQRLVQYYCDSDSSETIEALDDDDDDDDVVVEVPPAKGGRKPEASKAAKPPAAASRKRGPEVVAIGVSPEKKARQMRF